MISLPPGLCGCLQRETNTSTGIAMSKMGYFFLMFIGALKNTVGFALQFKGKMAIDKNLSH